MFVCLVGAWAPHPLFLFVCFCFATQGCAGCAAKGVLGLVCGGVMWWDTPKGFRIDWCFQCGLYKSEGGVACQHLVLWNNQMDFPCQ